MTINFNASGKDRKRMVEKISEITSAPAKYLGVPSCAYEVGQYLISKNGELSVDDGVDKDAVDSLIEQLGRAGFHLESEHPGLGLSIQLPRAGLSDLGIENLSKLIDSKAGLIKQALGVETVQFELDAERISFPWFKSLPAAEEVNAYTHFLAALCRMAKDSKRVTAKEHEVENEKYAFRCFLLRLGFVGQEYKTERKILLRNLSGSSAFKTEREGVGKA